MTVDVSSLPANVRSSFRELGTLLARLAGDNLLSFSAFGGWLVDDPLFAATPARSVAVLARFDLPMLARLAGAGKKFGGRGLSAPLMMTPDYIAASCDVFPLELLEIQQTHVVLSGERHFQDLPFAKPEVRLQAERELKSELIQLRQGLLAAAGDERLLGPLCRTACERTTRVLRGLLFLQDTAALVRTADLLAAAERQTKLRLHAVERAVTAEEPVDFATFCRFYDEMTTLAAHVNQLG